MKIDEIINVACEALELNKDVLVCSNYGKTGCPQKQKYSECRMIITFILRSNKQQTPHRDISKAFNRLLKNGNGDHAISIYYFRTANNLIQTDKKFKSKLNLVLTKIGINNI